MAWNTLSPGGIDPIDENWGQQPLPGAPTSGSTGDLNLTNPCGPGEVMQPDGTCLPQNQTYDPVGNSGGCPEGQFFDPVTGQCNPPQNAGACGPGEAYDAQRGICVNINDSVNTQYPDGVFNPDGTPASPDPNWNYNNYVNGLGNGTGPLPAPPNVDPYAVDPSQDWMGMVDYEGVSPVNPQAEPFAYGDVQDFSDAAWEQSKRYLDPQLQKQDERYAQELINQGIDPYSDAGQKAFRQKEMAQSDLLSKSAFDALGFGAGLQNQMFGQDATRSQLANAMLQAQMTLGQRGHEFDTTAGMQANEQAFAQMMGLEGLNYRDYLTGVDQNRYQDSLTLALMGLAPGPGYSTVNAGLSKMPAYEYSGQQNYWNNLFGN